MPEDGKLTIPHPDFGAVNYTVVVVYLAAMLVIAWYVSRRVQNTSGFFIGGGKLNYIIVGISTFSTYLSALTMMALPAVAFGSHNLFWTIQYPFIIIPAFIVTKFIVQRYRDAGVISVYEYFEIRIHVSSRLLGAVSFIVFSVGRSGLVLLMPALAFHIVTGFSLPGTIIIMGTVITIYTVLGGITAVIWTDFAQTCIMVAGAFVSLIFILSSTGVSNFVDIATANDKFHVFFGGLDVTKELSMWLILNAVFEGVRCWATQQDMTQRYMTTPTTQKAKLSIWVAALCYIPFGYLFHFIGTALFVYYTISPDPCIPALVANHRTDAIYPYFVATRLPVGLAGLVIAAIFAAAMSSIDSCMNSSSAVCIEDFYKRFRRKEHSDKHYLKVARWLTLVWGVLTVFMALSFMNIHQAQVMWPKVMGVSTNGLLGLLGLALLPKRVNKWAAIIGFFTSYVALFAVMFGTEVNYLLWPLIGNAVCFVVAVAVNAIINKLA